jgi:hypothetical protein
MGFAVDISPAAADDDSQRKIDWQHQYSRVLAGAAKAEARIEASRKALRKARQRDRLKGEHRTKILAELEAAEQEAETARVLLEKFPESARRAGIPPGWLREVEDRQIHDES